MTTRRLLDVEPDPPKWTGTRALALRRDCPDCDGALVRVTVTQLCLLRGAGYGEARRITFESCRCTSRLSEVRAVNPRHL